MTCIVALEHNGVVYMGGDSASSDGMIVELADQPKVFQVKNFLIGYTSSFRMGQLLEHGLDVPANEGMDDLTYLVNVFIAKVRECFRAGGFSKIENGIETGGRFLLGYHGKVYFVSDDFQVTRRSDGYAACGSGEHFALAAIETIRRINNLVGVDTGKLDPENIVHTALIVAAKFSPFVRAPFSILSA